MEELKKHILILCSMVLLFPSFMSLAHITAHQNEKPCENLAATHFHKKTLDCELCDFRLTNLNTFTPVAFTMLISNLLETQFFDYYLFLSDYQKLPFELRGPPLLYHS